MVDGEPLGLLLALTFSSVAPPPVVTPAPTVGPVVGVGRAWSALYNKSGRKKKKLIDELDAHLLELKERIEEQPIEVVKERDWQADLGKLEAFYQLAVNEEIVAAQIRAQIAAAAAIIREMDDEDVLLLLSVH